MSESLKIRTPEGIEFALPLAGPVSRMLAFALDIGVVMTIGSVMQKVLGPLGFFGKDFSDAVRIISYFVISLAYMALAEWLWRGQTVGKRLLGLRVVDAGGFRLEPSQVIVRNLMRFVDGLPALYLVGGITCLVSRHRQRLGDLAAGTVVIRAPKAGAAGSGSVTGREIQFTGRDPPSGGEAAAEGEAGDGLDGAGSAAAEGRDGAWAHGWSCSARWRHISGGWWSIQRRWWSRCPMNSM